MKYLTLAAWAWACAGLALPALADPVFGLWRTEPDARGVTAMVQLVDCHDRICGVVVGSYDGQGRPLDSPHAGRAYIWDMEPRGSGRYRDGKQWLPENDRVYPARMDLQGDQLTVTRCSLVVVCRDQVWWRAN
jgi:hypothetical protein